MAIGQDFLYNPLLNIGLGMLQAAGPSTQQTSFGQALAQGVGQAQSAASQGQAFQLQQARLNATNQALDQAKREAEEKRRLTSALQSSTGQSMMQNPQALIQGLTGMGVSPDVTLPMIMQGHAAAGEQAGQQNLFRQQALMEWLRQAGTEERSAQEQAARERMALADREAMAQRAAADRASREAIAQLPRQLSPRDEAFAKLSPEQQQQVFLKPHTQVVLPTSEERKREQQSDLGTQDIEAVIGMAEKDIHYPHVPDFMASEEGKKMKAALTRAAQKLAYIQTGATYNPGEAVEYAQGYFPSVGDSKETILEKLKALKRDLGGYKFNPTQGVAPFSEPEPSWEPLEGGIRARVVK